MLKDKSPLFFTAIVTVACIAAFFAGYLFNNIQTMQSKIDGRAYQIELDADSSIIWDGKRKVTALPYDSSQLFDKAIIADNE